MFPINKKLLSFIFLLVMLTSCIFLPITTAIGNIGKLSDSSFYDTNDNLYVVGEVKNTGDVAVQNTNVRVVFYDSSDQKITAIEGYTDLNVILSQRKSFFNIRLLKSEGSLNVASYTIWFNWTDTEVGKPLGLVILSSSTDVDLAGHKHVTGQIQNQGNLNSINTEVSATFYNSSGVVVGTSWVFSNPTNLASNQIGEFDIELIYPTQVTQVASYSLTAESSALAFSPTSLLTPSSSPSPTATPTISPSTSPTPQTSTSVSPSLTPKTSSNPSSTPQNIQTTTIPSNISSTESPTTVVITIAAIVIIILSAIFLFYFIKKRKLPIKVENKQASSSLG